MVEEHFLEHFGIKGMKWGVRRSNPTGAPSSGTDRKVVKAQKKWEKKNGSAKVFFQDYSAAARHMNKVEIPRINNKPAYRDADLRGDTPLSRRYHKEMTDSLVKSMNDEAGKRGVSPDGTKRLKYTENNGDIEYRWDDVKHAGEGGYFKVSVDAKGHVTSVVAVEDSMAQTDPVGDFLEHYGVKGMRWGVRRSTATTDVETGGKAGGRVQTRGGDRQPHASDAVKAAALKQKARKSTVDSLSNAELQALVQRMNLEKQYDTLRPRKPSEQATKFIAETLLGIGKEQAKNYARDSVTNAIKNKG